MDYQEKSKILQDQLREMQQYATDNDIEWDNDARDPLERKMATKDQNPITFRQNNRSWHAPHGQSRGRGRGRGGRWGQNCSWNNIPRNDGHSYANSFAERDHRYWHTDTGSRAHSPLLRDNFSQFSNAQNFPKKRNNRPKKKKESKENVSVAPSDSVSATGSDHGTSITVLSVITSITPTELAKSISNFPGFKCSLIDLIDNCKFDHKKVKEIAEKFDEVFELEGSDIALKPKISICKDFIQQQGCLSKKKCRDLHICPSFVDDNCRDDECLMGHFFKTNHNKEILGKFLIVDFQIPLLKSILQLSCGQQSENNLGSRDLKICLNYNNTQCSDSPCDDLHLCLKYLAHVCSKDCSLNHSIAQKETSTLLNSCGISTNESPRDILTAIKSCPSVIREIENFGAAAVSKDPIAVEAVEQPKDKNDSEKEDTKEVKSTNWNTHFLGEVLVEEVCYYSVVSYCDYEESGCWRLHSDKHFHWQIQEKNKPWINLPNPQVLELEKNFCDPSINNFDLKPLDSSLISANAKGLLTTMRGRSIWNVDFDRMTLTLLDANKVSHSLFLRRLCSQFISDSELPPACSFAWYFLDKNNKWIEYGEADSTGEDGLKSSVNSDDIEAHRRQRPNSPLAFQSNKFSYIMDTVLLEQTNLKTKVVRKTRRRPRPHLKETEQPDATAVSDKLPSNWDPMKPDVRLIRVPLENSSQEFQDISNYVRSKQGNFTINKIERVQNQFLYYAFKNKLQSLKTIYPNENDLNIQQLFHGTKPDLVDSICSQNFDWRLHGTRSGQSFGRGIYFANAANYSYNYAQTDQFGQRHMFIAKVMVGSVVQGNSSTVRPPQNPQTNALYDTTVNNISNPSVFVKYDVQEYYPEYILSIT